MHEDNCFITLTYDDLHCPEDHSLVLRDIQLFVKDSEKKSVNFDFSTPVSTAALHIDLTITCASSDTVHLTSCSTKKPK